MTRDDAALLRRAQQLSARYLGGHARPSAVSWVATMDHRWGSCTPASARIRLSDRLAGAPGHVLDFVLLHELAHLLVDHHGPDFEVLVASFPYAGRAQAWLDDAAPPTVPPAQ